MSRELATRSSSYLSTNEDYFAELAREAQNLKGGGDGKAFLKFDGNSGDYMYGADDEDLKLGSRLAVNMRSYRRGWVIWLDGEVVHEEMTELGTPQATKGSLPDHGPYGEDDGPVEQYTIDFKMLDEPYVEMIFQANNASKRRAMAALLKDFANTFKGHPGEVPIIEIDEREFEAKTKGGKGRKVTKHAPVFKIVDWMPEEELLALTEGDPEDYDDDPKPRGRGRDKDEGRRSSRDEEERPARNSRRDRDEEERPARSSRRDEPEADERPARSRRDRDEPEADERPARSRRDRDEPEADERPARSRRDRDEPEADERPARSRRDRDEPVDDEPAPRGRGRDRDEPVDDEPEAARGRGRDRDEPEADDDAPPRRSGNARAPARPDKDEAPARRSSRDEAPADDGDDQPEQRGGRRGRF